MQSTETLDMIDVDTMLWHVGDFGRYQYMLISLFSLINAFSAFHYFGQTFISLVPEHRCKNLNKNLTHTSYLACSTKIIHPNETIELPCVSGWDYNSTYGYISLIQELNWVCKDDWKPVLGQSVFFIGSVLGSLGFGVLADHIGRLHVLVISNLFVVFGNLLTLLSSDAIVFGISRFIAGCATDSNFVMMYIIVMEYIRPSMRTFGLNLCIGVFYCLSCMAVPWVAVLLGHWKWFLLMISLPHLSILAFYLLVPESAQWLISKGKTEKAIICFERIAQINKKQVNQKVFDTLRGYANVHIKKNGPETFFGLIKTPKLRRKTFILMFKSMVMTLGYDAISRNINGFGLSPFLIFTISSSTILPACGFILAFQDKAGRKALASGALFISGLFTAGAGLILAISAVPNTVVPVIFAIISRLSINVAYNSGAQYAVELIPTVVRGQGVSAIHVIGYAASFFSPHILYLSNIWQPFPEVVLGILLVVGAVACLFLPETLNRTLPVTLEDGENFGEDERIFEFSCFNRNKTESTQTLSPKQNDKKYVI
ncbi:hypothetical protein RN001_016200 [Aquatica leii]|uniref:Major facilitator superfamily (MFS) profile domain-containing protein n=1 Tax=Aquatica leii TaxID=1421715 RepID=A0AAN7P1F1_9COLE|nr:hypothetical protein RN001_016200 [Aquatica leii]